MPLSAKFRPDHMSRETRAVGEVEPVDKKCPRSSPCTSHSSCPVATEKFKKLTELDRESKEYVELARDIKLKVCNKKEKAVCCDPEPGEGGEGGNPKDRISRNLFRLLILRLSLEEQKLH